MPQDGREDHRTRVRQPGEGWLSFKRGQRVSDRLLRSPNDEEVIVDEVHHHWIVYTVPMLEVVAAFGILWWFLFSSVQAAALLLVAAAALVLHAAWRSVLGYFDVFVITDLRVFRVSGLVPKKQASTPLSRILDITVDQTVLGLLLGYGHFTFESAAQEQGLRDIRFVPDPLRRDKAIQEQQMKLLRRPRTNHPES
jgi:uncharacterized membrane protein YdbT with pleckstrin-like domain